MGAFCILYFARAVVTHFAGTQGCKMRAFCILRACSAVQGCTHFAFCILQAPFPAICFVVLRAFCILQGLHLGSCKMRASTHFACLRKNARCVQFAFCIWRLLHAAARAGSNGLRDILLVGLGIRLGTYGVHWHSIGSNECQDIVQVGLGIRVGTHRIHRNSM